jgi:NAD(P)H-dependent flavin oxidoreductase YrpB (nitropropane dioxygenase family)
MRWVVRAELVAAAANSGALGFIAALTQQTPADLAGEIAKTRDLTDWLHRALRTAAVCEATRSGNHRGTLPHAANVVMPTIIVDRANASSMHVKSSSPRPTAAAAARVVGHAWRNVS